MPLSVPSTTAGDNGIMAIFRGFFTFNLGGQVGLFGAAIEYDPFNLIVIDSDVNPPNAQSAVIQQAGRYEVSFTVQVTSWETFPPAVIPTPANSHRTVINVIQRAWTNKDLTAGIIVNPVLPQIVPNLENAYRLIDAGDDGVQTWGTYENMGNERAAGVYDLVPGNAVSIDGGGLIPDWWAPQAMPGQIRVVINQLVSP